jgi:O-antigen/teichoic acid export membrane protein
MSGIHGYFAYGMAVMLVIALAVAVMYDGIVIALFPGGDYLESKRAFLFLLPGIMLYGATTVYEGVLAASRRGEAVGSISIQTLLINVILGVFLVHAFGIAGAALAGTLSFFWYYLAITETLDELQVRVNRWDTILYCVVAAGIAVFLVDIIGASLLTAMMSAVLTILMLVYVEYLDLNVRIGGIVPMELIERAKAVLKLIKEKRTLH